ncbi:putative dual specificity protein phosphatase DSP8 [Iris pallida]|uniref:phosphatidylglycerophosphatase n=1 Tax=Iris pallida TaxID=29817 RepID=A0AAX6EKM7_IRIPA|nr:putative dual specificity protein phosphatase DSP8 [Iris pallida]
MYIEELNYGDPEEIGKEEEKGEGISKLGFPEAKRVVVGVGARFLFYPTLLYNVVRNKIQSEFRWWDRIDQFLLLGAVPFPSDVPSLKQLGVSGVITLNEPYETLVPTSLYLAHGIEHLMIPTRDYCFAPSFGNICKAVDFIHNNASCGKTTYVHCKAGRGRSTTIVLCYLVQHKQMTPTEAYEYVKLRRPRVLLASPQWQAVQEYYRIQVIKVGRSSCLNYPIIRSPASIAIHNFVSFDESSFVLVTKSDLDGYHPDCRASNIWAELSLVCRVQFAGQAALASLSCFWLRCHSPEGVAMLPENKLGRESCSMEADQLGMGHPRLVSGVAAKL